MCVCWAVVKTHLSRSRPDTQGPSSSQYPLPWRNTHVSLVPSKLSLTLWNLLSYFAWDNFFIKHQHPYFQSNDILKALPQGGQIRSGSLPCQALCFHRNRCRAGRTVFLLSSSYQTFIHLLKPDDDCGRYCQHPTDHRVGKIPCSCEEVETPFSHVWFITLKFQP